MDRATRRGEDMLRTLGRELRSARVGRGLSQETVARAVGISRQHVARLEDADLRSVPIVTLCRFATAVGLEFSARLFPGGSAVRDAAQLALVGRLRPRVSASVTWTNEAPMPILGDQRAWDVLLGIGPIRIGMDAETRLGDVQATVRRVALKQRDSGVDHVALLVADTRHNRGVVRDHGEELLQRFPLPKRQFLEALGAGRDPGGSSLVLL